MGIRNLDAVNILLREDIPSDEAREKIIRANETTSSQNEQLI